MLTSLVLRNSLEELNSITKTGFTVFDVNGNVILSVGDNEELDSSMLSSFIVSMADSQTVGSCHIFKVFDDDELTYILAANGSSDEAYNYGRIAVGQLKMLLSVCKEKLDKNSFFQNLLMDNFLLVDMYSKAKKLHLDTNAYRIVYVVQTIGEKDALLLQLMKGMFAEENGDYVTEIDEKSIVVIKNLQDNTDEACIDATAQMIVDTVSAELMVNVRVGYGTVVSELKDVSKSYKEAGMSVEVGKIFYEERRVNSYTSLGIGRLIYQLPVNLCQIFIEEIFRESDPSKFDEEIVSTVYKFFENNLNVSETSRQLFIHRNTLVYRIEKLKSVTGLDVRVFDDALTFMIAMMVYNYMRYLEDEEN